MTVCATMAACGASKKPTIEKAACSWQEAESIPELKKIAGFSIVAPETIKKLNKKVFRAINDSANRMAEVIYCNDEDEEVRIRKSAGANDISGNYEAHKDNVTITNDELDITLKGDDGRFHLAVWTDGVFTYSVDASNGLTEAEIVLLIIEIE